MYLLINFFKKLIDYRRNFASFLEEFSEVSSYLSLILKLEISNVDFVDKNEKLNNKKVTECEKS